MSPLRLLSLLVLTGCLLPLPLSAEMVSPFSQLNVNRDQIANNDTLAWSLLGVLTLTLGMVSACGWGIYRQFRNITPEAQLLQELHEQSLRQAASPPAAGPAPDRSLAPWEKPADWWRQQPQD